MIERELVREVSECLPDGRLDPAAVGWSRRPLHRGNLRGPWGRQKRWDYWCVTTREGALSLTIADLDYLGLASALYVDFASGREVEKVVPVPLARGFAQPETVGGGDVVFDRLGLHLAFLEEGGGTRLRARFRTLRHSLDADVLVALPPGHETLTVLVPWSERRFQVTSKHNTRPATGRIVVDGRARACGPENDAFGCLDWGRGVWPTRTVWNWASASGRASGRTIGLQFGAQWTDGTGATENALCIDGKVQKLSEDVVFDYDRRDFSRPWRIETAASRAVRLTFTPFHEKQVRVPWLTELHLCFGRYSGTIEGADGSCLRVDGLIGWAEEMRARW